MHEKNIHYNGKELYIRDTFREIAPIYEFMNHLLSFNLDRLWRRKSIARFFRPAHLQILDACCGTGELTELLRQRLSPGGSIIGIDFCEKMLEIAEKRHRSIKNIRYELANIQHLCFPDGYFDAVYNCYSLRNLSDIPGAIREMSRVIKPGGQLIIVDLTLPHSPLLLWYLLHVVPLAGRLFHGKRGPYSYLSASIRQFCRPEELRECLINEGLDQVEYIKFFGGVVTAVCGTVSPKQMP